MLGFACLIVLLSVGTLRAASEHRFMALNVGLACLLVYAVTPIHELGHVIAARATGQRALVVRTGGFMRLPRFAIAGIDVALGIPPDGAATLVLAGDHEGLRARRLFMISGGPAVNLLLLLAAAHFREMEIEHHLAPAWALMAANAFSLVLNVLPGGVATAFGSHGNDGMLFMQALRAPLADLALGRTLPLAALSLDRLADHDVKGAAAAIAAAGVDETSHPRLLAARGMVRLAQDQLVAARDDLLAARAGARSGVRQLDALIESLGTAGAEGHSQGACRSSTAHDAQRLPAVRRAAILLLQAPLE